MNHLMVLTSLGMVLGCASTPGAHPHDMSEAQHQARAAEDRRSAEAHAGQYDPSATAEARRCRPPARGVVCWTSVTNPTEAHRKAAEMYRRQAADHRAAAAALRDAEATACAGIAPDDRDISPFEHTEDISSVVALSEKVGGAAAVSDKTGTRLRSSRTAGAVVTFRAVPGMTAEWLQRVTDCHLARNAALGNQLPEMPDCPLVPRAAAARVSSTGAAFAVEIRSDDDGAAQEILARAQRLLDSARAAGKGQ